MKSVLEFAARHRGGPPLVMVSTYEAWSARLLAEVPEVDCLLVGDSVAMVLYGEASTVAATPAMMELHTRAVARAAGDKLVVADFPFLAARRGRAAALDCAAALVRAGADAVKIEGVTGHEDIISHLVGSGIPVMGHLGLTPQSVHALGGYRVQGRTAEGAERLRAEARAVEQAGVFGYVLELVPADLARELTAAAHVPTIGIGAGGGTTGQVLVFHDLIGLNPEFRARFVRRFAETGSAALAGVRAFAQAVRAGTFPGPEESF